MFSESYVNLLPSAVIDRYHIVETRNATAKLHATNPDCLNDIIAVTSSFSFNAADVVTPGGQETDLAGRLNTGFRDRGWRETRYISRTEFTVEARGHPEPTITQTQIEAIEAVSYWIDNVKDRVVLDIEWNAKDGNLYRDVSFYKLLHRYDMVDAAVMITRTQDDLRQLGRDLGRPNFLSTTTTTNLDKLLPILTRGEADECPLLVLAITAGCFDAA